LNRTEIFWLIMTISRLLLLFLIKRLDVWGSLAAQVLKRKEIKTVLAHHHGVCERVQLRDSFWHPDIWESLGQVYSI